MMKMLLVRQPAQEKGTSIEPNRSTEPNTAGTEPTEPSTCLITTQPTPFPKMRNRFRRSELELRGSRNDLKIGPRSC
eukprot:2156479-Alexandrium_andersonii.AAC.1